MPDSQWHRSDFALPDTLQFMQLLWAVVHGLETTSKRMRSGLGITGPQRLALRIVGLFPGISARELAATRHVHPSTLTGILQRLVEQRLLERIHDAHDRRRAVLRLTPRGAALNRRRAGTVERAITLALDGTAPADRRAAHRVLERMARHLQAAPARPERRKML
jgi:DNA-binding MarR family transcriptional regulator